MPIYKNKKRNFELKYKKVNPLKEFKVKTVTYKDVPILQKFVTDKGKIRSREITGVTAQQQREVARAIKNARELALMPFVPKKAKSEGYDG
ncbi:MAG: 30S ribosomal protein S18 [Bifidobacteriaceae bacterium]|jgi:small subunit ribosomal protein S18|nr:30S ribosomal protein S18 [Bifidobacteriaceae bacterium]